MGRWVLEVIRLLVALGFERRLLRAESTQNVSQGFLFAKKIGFQRDVIWWGFSPLGRSLTTGSVTLSLLWAAGGVGVGHPGRREVLVAEGAAGRGAGWGPCWGLGQEP